MATKNQILVADIVRVRGRLCWVMCYCSFRSGGMRYIVQAVKRGGEGWKKESERLEQHFEEPILEDKRTRKIQQHCCIPYFQNGWDVFKNDLRRTQVLYASPGIRDVHHTAR